jgi:hypothetical protein
VAVVELYDQLRSGRPGEPKLVFFFERAPLFDEAPAVLLDKIEQVIRLTVPRRSGSTLVSRTRGYPEAVLGQLGNRVQHALRALRRRI